MKVTMKPYTLKYKAQGCEYEWTHVCESKQGAINRFATDYFYPIARREINLTSDHIVAKYMPAELSIKGCRSPKFCAWTAFLSRAHMFWYTEKMYARERGDDALQKLCTTFLDDISMKTANRGR